MLLLRGERPRSSAAVRNQDKGDLAAAERIRAEVESASGPDKAWPPLVGILNEFGVNQLTPAAAERIDASLRGVGLEVDPPLPSIDHRSGTVCLSLPGCEPSCDAEPVKVTEIVGGEWNKQPAAAPRTEGSLLWVDVDVMAGSRAEISAALEGLSLGITAEAITDLYLPDAVPKRTDYGDGVRAVSAAAVVAREQTNGSLAGAVGHDGCLTLRLVEIIAGPGWIVTCWHRERVLTNHESRSAAGSVPDADRAAVMAEVREQVRSDPELKNGVSSGDLGVLILESLAGTYAQARIELSAWLDAWELSFFTRCERNAPTTDDQATLVNLRWLGSEFKRCVAPLDIPGHQTKRCWFDDVRRQDNAQAVDRLVEDTVQELDRHADRVRSAFDMLHLQFAQAHERSTKRLQDRLELITAVFLAPAAVAAFFGANTWLPGGNGIHKVASFEIMVAAMVLGVIATLVILKFTRTSGLGPRRAEAGRRAAS